MLLVLFVGLFKSNWKLILFFNLKDEEDDDEANPKKKIKLSNNAKGAKAVPNAKNSKKKWID